MEKNNKNKNSKKTNNKKVVKLKNDFNANNMISNKKLKTITIVVLILLLALIIRIAWIQFIQGSFLKEMSYSQQNINQIISPKRGNIYDSTGQPLASSTQVDTITINPKKIKAKDKTEESTKALQEKVAKGLSEIFELDYNETLEKVQSTSAVETIARKVEQDKVDELKTWMKTNKISVGINIDEDTKRYYPYSTLASAVIGFCGTDNDGRYGIENKWNSVLSGTAGKIVSSKDGSQSEIPNSEQTYIAAQNGSDLTLTIDINIQTTIEKYLKQAVEDNSCERGGNVIVMNPKTGDILGMASYPNYDLNNPNTPNSTLSTNWDSLSSEEKSSSLYKMWSNKSIHETYEPGSTFKTITAAVALEENITGTDVTNDFICNGAEIVNGTKISCWRANPHGYLTLRGALENSCNPALMQLGKRIGASTLYKYYKAFGLFDKTGVALTGEANSIFHDLSDVGPVELATMSFGQRFNVTPLQMITAISAIANDGVLMQPRIVKEITNSETGAKTTVEPVKVRQVLSKQTSDKVKSMMESVVLHGTGGNAKVNGYSIGGKTGTSEPPSNNKDAGYVASYVAISPIENTEVVLLLTLYKPQGKSHQGGTIAGPVVGQMLSEILPYLEVSSEETTTSDTTSGSNSTKTLPNVTSKTVTEAKKILEEYGLTASYSVSGNANSLLVTDQVPKPGTQLLSGSIVKLYSEENNVRTSVTVPDLKGMSAAQATNSLKSKNLNISIEGTGVVISQDYAKDSTVEEGTVIKVTLKQNKGEAH